MLGNEAAIVIGVLNQSTQARPSDKRLPDSVCVLRQGLVLSFPEDLWVGNPGDATLQPHRMTLGHAGVLQLLHERGHLVHLLGCGRERVTDCLLSPSTRSLKSGYPTTCNYQFQVEGVLAGPVAGDAGVDAGVAAGHGLDDQRVHAVFPHQHLMGGVGADCLTVQLPDEVRGGQAAHLHAGEGRF